MNAQVQNAANSEFDWPSFLGANRDSKSLETGILTDWSGGRLEVVWTVEVGNGYALGTVSDGRFFQFDAVDEACRLIARDALTGQEQWRYQYQSLYKDSYGFEAGPRATPVVDGERVYVYGAEGQLHCVNAVTGQLIWKLDLTKEYNVLKNFFGVGSTPLIHDQHLIVMVGGSPADNDVKRLDRALSNGTAVVALDKITGREIYRCGDDLASYSSIQLYQHGGKKSGVAWLRANVIGFELGTGKQLWSFPYRAKRYESVNAATPVTSGNQIFLTESYGPGAILLQANESGVETIWQDANIRNRSLACHWSTPVLHNGFLYGCHGEGSARSELRCVEWETGKIRWLKRGLARASLTFIDDHLIVLDERGQLVLIKADPEGYDEITRYSDKAENPLPLEYPSWSAPVVAQGHLYIRGKNKIFCLKLSSR